MCKENILKHQLARIIGQEEKGVFFVLGFVEGLRGKTAKLKPIDSGIKQIVRGVPIQDLEYIEPPRRDIIDCFCRIVVQALKPNLGEIDRSIFHCNTIFKAYQLRPLLSYIGNPEKRILIADETGLGKTIEAGYILINEMSKNPMKRVLIVCPSNLKYKWKGELWYRFGLGFDIISGKKLIELLKDNRRQFHCIVSMDATRGISEEAFFDVPFENGLDMLIVDEIHHLIGRGGETLRRKLGFVLSFISKRVIALSATPIHLEFYDLKRILDIVNPGWKTLEQFDDAIVINSHLNKLSRLLSIADWKNKEVNLFNKEIMELERTIANGIGNSRLVDLKSLLETKTRSSEIKDKKLRYKLRREIRKNSLLSGIFVRSRRIEVGEERNRTILNEQVSLDSEVFEAYQNQKIVSVSEKSLFKEIDDFLTTSFSYVHRMQLSSCLPAMIGLLRDGMRGFNVWAGDRWDELDGTLDVKQRKECSRLADKYGLLLRDSKWERLVGLIKKLRNQESVRKVIVFTQWIPTINYFRKKKNELDFSSYLISGQDHQEARARTAQSFQKHEGFAVLFATDVMAEGVDLQSADCVVNYDFPFNPQKLEQRIGRVDRIGQKSENITVINILVEDSTDQKIFNTLTERIDIFKRSIGDMPDIISEENEKQGLIDEDKIIKELSVTEIKSALLQSEKLSGLDDVLDQEIIEAHNEQRGTAHGLRWLVFERLMLLVLGEKKLRKATVGKSSIIFRDIDETDIEALTNIVAVKQRGVVQAELLSYLEKDGTLEITFRNSAYGLYLPINHPLMRKAIEISFQSFFKNQKINQIKPEVLWISGKANQLSENKKYIVLIESSFRSELYNEREWSWWAFDKSDHEILRLKKSPIEGIWNSHSQGEITIRSANEEVPIPDNVWDRIKKHHDFWINTMKEKSEINYVILKKAEIKKLQKEKQILNIQIQKKPQLGNVQQIRNRLEDIKKRIDYIDSFVERLKSEKDTVHDKTFSNIRVGGMFVFEK